MMRVRAHRWGRWGGPGRSISVVGVVWLGGLGGPRLVPSRPVSGRLGSSRVVLGRIGSHGRHGAARYGTVRFGSVRVRRVSSRVAPRAVPRSLRSSRRCVGVVLLPPARPRKGRDPPIASEEGPRD